MANRPPFPAFGAMAGESPASFIFNGDAIYGDSTTSVAGPAKSVPEYWAEYEENRADFLLRLCSRGHAVDRELRRPRGGEGVRVADAAHAFGRAAFHD
jgi:hypothetical protein